LSDPDVYHMKQVLVEDVKPTMVSEEDLRTMMSVFRAVKMNQKMYTNVTTHNTRGDYVISDAITRNQMNMFFRNLKISNNQFRLDYIKELVAHEQDQIIMGPAAFEDMKAAAPLGVDIGALEKDTPTKYTDGAYRKKLMNAATDPKEKEAIAKYLARPTRFVDIYVKLTECQSVDDKVIEMKFCV
jgi:hypothetical protein